MFQVIALECEFGLGFASLVCYRENLIGRPVADIVNKIYMVDRIGFASAEDQIHLKSFGKKDSFFECK